MKKELPAVTKRLRQQVVEWETASGHRFLVQGAWRLRATAAHGAAAACVSSADVDAAATHLVRCHAHVVCADELYLDVLDGEEAAETRAKEDARAAREAKRAADGAPASLAASAGPGVVAETMKSAAPPAAPRSTSAGRVSIYAKSRTAGGAAGAGGGAALSRKPSVTASTGTFAAAAAAAAATAGAGASEATDSAAAPAAAHAHPPAAPLEASKEANTGRGVLVKASATASDKAIPPPTVPTEPAAFVATVAAVTVSEAAKASAARMLQML